jgi:hypothetical protein
MFAESVLWIVRTRFALARSARGVRRVITQGGWPVPAELICDEVGGAGRDQAPMVLRRVAKVLAPDRRAVLTTVRTSASPAAAHIAW